MTPLCFQVAPKLQKSVQPAPLPPKLKAVYDKKRGDREQQAKKAAADEQKVAARTHKRSRQEAQAQNRAAARIARSAPQVCPRNLSSNPGFDDAGVTETLHVIYHRRRQCPHRVQVLRTLIMQIEKLGPGKLKSTRSMRRGS